MTENDLCFYSAVELAELIRGRSVSAIEVLDAHLERIARINPRVNAVVTLAEDRARAQALEVDRRLGRGDEVGPLAGLPAAHKDLHLTKGVRTTFGSPLYKDYLPEEDQLTVERMAGAGAVSLGKTNTPEFGAGSQTFNQVFGRTLNPYDPAMTCGGSSGGAAVGLACGMFAVAEGSDLGGSLRNPASFCNVVGLRPSPGRVPSWPETLAWSPFSVEGPMGRTASDVALLLSVLAGPDPRSPISIEQPGEVFRQPLDWDFRGVRAAFSADFGGLPVDRRVVDVIERTRPVWESIGLKLDDACPDFSEADDAFRAWRAWSMEASLGPLLDQHRDQFKDTLIWNIEQGRKLTGPDLGRAEIGRTRLYHRVRSFMADRPFLILPTVQAPPFDVNQPYLTEIDGHPLETYLDWMKSCYFISITGLPAVSVPAGFTPEGLPVGVQIVGRHHDELSVLRLAHAFQQAAPHHHRRPPLLEDAAAV